MIHRFAVSVLMSQATPSDQFTLESYHHCSTPYKECMTLQTIL